MEHNSSVNIDQEWISWNRQMFERRENREVGEASIQQLKELLKQLKHDIFICLERRIQNTVHYLFLMVYFFIVSAKNIFFVLLIKQQEPQPKWSFIESTMSGTDNSNYLPKTTFCAIFAWSKFKWIKTKYKEWERLTFNHLLSWLWDSALFCINCTSPEEFKLLLSLGGRGLKRMTKILI